ncbi:hypothetical protein BDQ17DRAFT_462475 [Cyathus striatus]|nr:hypothetical protein BDQ17DRAFT_462475 [Cyathus striatus]
MPFVEATTTDAGRMLYICQWGIGTGKPCGYEAGHGTGRPRSSIYRHVIGKHLGMRRFKCTYCRDKSYTQKVSLKAHISRKHPEAGLPLHHCDQPDCGKTFTDPARYSDHLIGVHNIKRQVHRKPKTRITSFGDASLQQMFLPT